MDYLISLWTIAFEFMKGLKRKKKNSEQNIVIESKNKIHKNSQIAKCMCIILGTSRN